MMLPLLLSLARLAAMAAGLSVNPLPAHARRPREVPVDWLDVRPPQNSPVWQLALAVESQAFRLVVEETAMTLVDGSTNYENNNYENNNHEGEKVISARGEAYFRNAAGHWAPAGRARLALLELDGDVAVRGSFFVHGDQWHLGPLGQLSGDARSKSAVGSKSGPYSMWRESELPSESMLDHLGSLAALALDAGPQEDSTLVSALVERSDDGGGVGGGWPTYAGLQSAQDAPATCFPRDVVAPIGVVADANFLRDFTSLSAAYLYITDTVNKASQVWELGFNVTLSLSAVVSAHDGLQFGWNWACNASDNTIDALQARLSAVSDWRKAARPHDGLALWTLFTDCPSADIVGLAWQASACTSGGANVVHHTVLDYRVLAHEIGHVFGAVHDCTNTTCGTSTVCCPRTPQQCDARGQFIMSPGSDADQFLFSPCTQANVCEGVANGHVNTSCLAPKQQQQQLAPSTQTSEKAEAAEDHTVPNRQLAGGRCLGLTDPAAYETCWRDAQCRDWANSSAARACLSVDRESGGKIGGSPAGCNLLCFDAEQCHDTGIALLDGSPCGSSHATAGVCAAGQCVPARRRTTPAWFWVVIGLAAAVGGGALVACAVLAAAWLRRRPKPQALPQSADHDDLSITDFGSGEPGTPRVGQPHLVKEFITPSPKRGLPLMLPYSRGRSSSDHSSSDHHEYHHTYGTPDYPRFTMRYDAPYTPRYDSPQTSPQASPQSSPRGNTLGSPISPISPRSVSSISSGSTAYSEKQYPGEK